MAKKRGPGEGTVLQRNDGRWVATLSMGYVGGRRIRASAYANNYKEASEKLIELRKRKNQGLPLPSNKLTVGQFLGVWLANKKSNVRPSTFKSYSDIVRVHIEPALGSIVLAKLSPMNVQTLLTRLRETDLSSRRVKYVYVVLRSALAVARRQHLVVENVAELVDPPSAKPSRESLPLTPTEVPVFLKAIEGHPKRALFVVALGLGLRQGEILGLRWSDLDFDKREVSVARQAQRIGSGPAELVEVKTKAGRRTVSLPALVASALKDQRIAREEDAKAAGKELAADDLVFVNRAGGPVSGFVANQAFQRVLKRAGLPTRPFHALRHSAASLLIFQGSSAKEVQVLLGHANIQLTLDTYTHMFAEAKRATADRMDAILKGSS